MLHKIGMIKALREFSVTQFGVELGLKEAKDIIDPIFEAAMRNRRLEVVAYLTKHKEAGLTKDYMLSIIDAVYTEPWNR